MPCSGNGSGTIFIVAPTNLSPCFIVCVITITICIKLLLYFLQPQNYHYNKMYHLQKSFKMMTRRFMVTGICKKSCIVFSFKKSNSHYIREDYCYSKCIAVHYCNKVFIICCIMQYSWGTNHSKQISQLIQSKQAYSTTGTSRFGAACQLKCIFRFFQFFYLAYLSRGHLEISVTLQLLIS